MKRFSVTHNYFYPFVTLYTNILKQDLFTLNKIESLSCILLSTLVNDLRMQW